MTQYLKELTRLREAHRRPLALTLSYETSEAAMALIELQAKMIEEARGKKFIDEI